MFRGVSKNKGKWQVKKSFILFIFCDLDDDNGEFQKDLYWRYQ